MKASSYPLEQDLGIEYYGTGTPGIGGKLRTVAEDFIVHEVPSAFPENGKYLICRLTKRRCEHQRAVNRNLTKIVDDIKVGRCRWADNGDLAGGRYSPADTVYLAPVRIRAAVGRKNHVISHLWIRGKVIGMKEKSFTGAAPH